MGLNDEIDKIVERITAPARTVDQSRRVFKAPEPPAFDWRALLKLYMTHILHEESVTYVRGLVLLSDLTPEQGAAISEVEAEVKKENPDECV